MPFWKKKPALPEADPALDVEPEPELEPELANPAALVYTVQVPEHTGPQVGDRYLGAVCFANGSHYPILVEDGVEVGPDWDHRLLWIDSDPTNPAETPDAHYEYAAADAPTHLHLYHQREVSVEVQ
jgi:hypothetical protein